MALVGTNTPGEFVIPELGRSIRLVEWEEKDIYDTVVAAAGANLQGGTMTFFTTPQGKTYQDTNVRTASKLPARHELITLKVGLFVMPMWGTSTPDLDDMVGFYAEGFYRLSKNAKIQMSEQHLWGMATGYGFVAYGIDNSAGAQTVTPGNIGVASPAAIPPLLVPFTITHEDDFDASVQFQASGAGALFNGVDAPAYTTVTLNDDLPVKNILHGFVKSPGTK